MLLVLVLLAPLGAGCSRDPAPSVLLITVDTLRADHLGAYGADPSRTPHLDRLAGEATVFERAAAPMPLTRPSHFSLFSSLYPREHGVLHNGASLPADVLTVTEVFRDHGYRTAAFVGVSLLGPESGVGKGFELLDTPSGQQRAADEVVRQALGWISGVGKDEKFFAWVHLFDPHQPYAPPSSYREDADAAYREDADAALERTMPSVSWESLRAAARLGGGDVPRAVLEHARRLYRGEVAWTDNRIGALLDGVSERREADDVFVVLTADHGECFEKGSYFEHADCVWQGALRIPLIVRHPRSFTPGARVATQVSIIDVAPTLLAAAGIEIPEGFSGMALQEVGGSKDRRVLVQLPFYPSMDAWARMDRRRSIRSVAGVPTRPLNPHVETVGIVGSPWKYIRTGDAEQLHRLAPGEEESENVAADNEAALRQLRPALDALLAEHPLNLIDPGEISEGLRSTLKALGYLE